MALRIENRSLGDAVEKGFRRAGALHGAALDLLADDGGLVVFGDDRFHRRGDPRALVGAFVVFAQEIAGEEQRATHKQREEDTLGGHFPAPPLPGVF
jgi:hypothetical protein